MKLDETEYTNILEVFVNSLPVKDVIMEIIQDKNRPSLPDILCLLLESSQPYIWPYIWQPFDYELHITQDRRFRGIITKITKKDGLCENPDKAIIKEKLRLFGCLPRPERVYLEPFLVNRNIADKDKPSITLVPNKYYVRQIIERNL